MLQMVLVVVGPAGCDGSDPAGGASTPEPPGAPTVEPPEFPIRVTWQVDGRAPMELYSRSEPRIRMVDGAECSTSWVLSGNAALDPTAAGLDDEIFYLLTFPAPPAAGVEAPHTPAEEWRRWVPSSNYWAQPLVLFPEGGPSEVLFGGRLHVVQWDERRAEIRFDGGDLQLCARVGAEDCEPIEGATLSIDALLPEIGIPSAPDACARVALPFQWPDGWDGCATYDDDYGVRERPCPSR